MTNIQKRAYKEVIELLNHLHLTNEIPLNVLHYIEKNQDTQWNFTYNDDLNLEEQNMLKQTAILFSALYLLYICKNPKEKEELKQIYKENERKMSHQNDFEAVMKELREKEETKKQEANLVSENKSLTTTTKGESLFTKLKKWLKSVFSK